MDSIVVDVTGIAGAAPGDVATIIGADGGMTAALDEVAGAAGTIGYEMLTRMGARLERVYAEGPA